MALKDNPDTIILRLIDGQILQSAPGHTTRVLNFSRHDVPIDLPAIEKFRQRGKDREYVLPELLRIGWGDGASESVRMASQASLNYRMAEVAMMIFLPLLAIALAVPPKRSTSSLGVFVSIVMVTVYHKLCEYGQGVAAAGRANPLLIQWGPFVVFAIIILWMYWRIAYVPGGQPIGALERFAENIGKRLRALLGRRKSMA
jgi:lipopolysaccharide export system permease protein